MVRDNTMISALYNAYTFGLMCFVSPADLLFRIALVCPIVFAPPNSLQQLGAAAAVECGQLLFLLTTNPFTNQWIDALAQLGSVHQILQLALLSLHRTLLNENPDSNGCNAAMIVVSAVYGAFVVFVIAKTVLIPLLWQRLLVAEHVDRRRDEEDARGTNVVSEVGPDKLLLTSIETVDRASSRQIETSRPHNNDPHRIDTDTDAENSFAERGPRT
jgi:hypothetical protein